jgi:hypothetical protein
MSENVKLTTKGDMNARIAKRLLPSNEHATAHEKTTTGSGAQRVIHTIHHSGSNAAYGGGGRDEEGR